MARETRQASSQESCRQPWAMPPASHPASRYTHTFTHKITHTQTNSLSLSLIHNMTLTSATPNNTHFSYCHCLRRKRSVDAETNCRLGVLLNIRETFVCDESAHFLGVTLSSNVKVKRKESYRDVLGSKTTVL